MSVIYQASSYLLLTPAYYVRSTIKYALGYSAAPTSDSTVLLGSASDLSISDQRRTGNIGLEREETEEETRMRKALEDAMRNYESDDEDDGSQFGYREETSKCPGEEEEESDRVAVTSSDRHGEETTEYLESLQTPKPSSLPDLTASDDTVLSPSFPEADSALDIEPMETLSPPSPPTTVNLLYSPSTTPPFPHHFQPHDITALQRRSYFLSASLSRLSRRATICLSTLDSLQAQNTTIDSSSTSPAVHPVSPHLLEEQKSELVGQRQTELIERVLGEDLRDVELEAEEFVEQVIAAEGQVVLPRGQGHTKNDSQEKAKVEEAEEIGWSWFRSQSQYKDFNQVEWSSEEGTNAEDFCEAVEGLTRLAEYLTPALAGLATNDIGMEIKKIRTRTTVEKVATLEQIVSVERSQRRKIATEAINWLLLILNFGLKAYQMNLDSEQKEELSASFTRVWDQEYYKHFNFLVRPLFKILIKACPSRQSFYSKLGSPTELVASDFGHWLKGIEVVSNRFKDWEVREKAREGRKKKR